MGSKGLDGLTCEDAILIVEIADLFTVLYGQRSAGTQEK